MKVHRFFVGNEVELRHDFWINGGSYAHQMLTVLRLRAGEQVVLFDGQGNDRLYKIVATEAPLSLHFELITELSPKLPEKDVYLFFALLKKDKNEWVLQKCTELGVSHFVPIITERTEKLGFDDERARKIVIEASEQCGRSDIPDIREPLNLATALNEYKNKLSLYVAEQENGKPASSQVGPQGVGVFVGPEGGWTSSELAQCEAAGANPLSLGDFTLRAETACVTATAKLIGV